jgi:hypothetical protein
MPWHRVVIEKDKPAADLEAEALMNRFGPAYRSAGLPEGAKVFRREIPSGGYIFYFNPAASLAAMEIFPLFEASECLEIPDLDGCLKVRF